jgi:hypothetical protein
VKQHVCFFRRNRRRRRRRRKRRRRKWDVLGLCHFGMQNKQKQKHFFLVCRADDDSTLMLLASAMQHGKRGVCM